MLPTTTLVVLTSAVICQQPAPPTTPTGAKLVIDALCAILHHHVGPHFGLDENSPNDRDRDHQREGWKVYAHYLDQQRVAARGKKDGK